MLRQSFWFGCSCSFVCPDSIDRILFAEQSSDNLADILITHHAENEADFLAAVVFVQSSTQNSGACRIVCTVQNNVRLLAYPLQTSRPFSQSNTLMQGQLINTVILLGSKLGSYHGNCRIQNLVSAWQFNLVVGMIITGTERKSLAFHAARNFLSGKSFAVNIQRCLFEERHSLNRA